MQILLKFYFSVFLAFVDNFYLKVEYFYGIRVRLWKKTYKLTKAKVDITQNPWGTFLCRRCFDKYHVFRKKNNLLTRNSFSMGEQRLNFKSFFFGKKII